MSSIADATLAEAGAARVAWADGQMPVLRSLRQRLADARPLAGTRIAACLHVTAETANLVRALAAGGAEVALCAANPLSTQDDVCAALVDEGWAEVHARRGESLDEYAAHVATLVGSGPQVTLDDGADLLTVAHAAGRADALLGATEETTAGLVRVRALADAGELRCPVVAVNEAWTERLANDRYGTGQSVLDGILRATNLLLAGRTVVVLGYGVTGQGIAQRARGAGARVVVCEIDPLRALEACMEGFEVLPALQAAEVGEVLITATGSRDVLRAEHLERLRDGAVLANAGHFDVEIDRGALRELAVGGAREVLPLVEQHTYADGRQVNLLAEGRVVNLAAGQGHPPAAMDLSFALHALVVADLVARAGTLAAGVHAVGAGVDAEVARLKLASLGVRIDEQDAGQRAYREAWAPDAAPPPRNEPAPAAP